jgi:hypothetical protein
MNRRMDRDFKVFWRRLSPRYFKMVMTLIVTCLLFSMVVYLAFRYLLYPIKTTYTKKTTTTTTTTTISTTTKKYFGQFSLSEIIKKQRNSFFQISVVTLIKQILHSPMVLLVH